MADEVVAPVAETAAPETTVTETSSTPTETSTPVTETTQVAETPPEEFRAPAKLDTETSGQYLKRATAEKAAWQAKKEGKVAPEVAKPAEPAKVEPAKPAEPVKPEAEATPDPDEFEQEEEGIATSALAEKLKADPELEAKLEAAGIKNAVFANARLADKATQFLDEFPGGLEDAKFAKQGATNFAEFDDTISSVSDVQSFAGFVQKAMPFSYVLDDKGEPVLDAQGKPVNDGSIGRFVENAVAYGATVHPQGVVQKLLGSDKGKEALLQEIQSLGDDQDEELKAALEIVTERLHRGPSAAADENSVASKKLAAERQSIEAEKSALAQQREAEKQQTLQKQDLAIATDMSNRIDKSLDSFMSRYEWMTEFERNAARKEIQNLTYERIKGDPMYASRAAANARKAYSQATHDERVALSVAAFKAHLPAAAKAILEKAGAKLVSKQKEKDAKVTTQIAASKEPKGGLTTPGAKPVLTNEEIGKQARENLMKAKQDPSDSKLLLAEMRRLKSGQ